MIGERMNPASVVLGRKVRASIQSYSCIILTNAATWVDTWQGRAGVTCLQQFIRLHTIVLKCVGCENCVQVAVAALLLACSFCNRVRAILTDQFSKGQRIKSAPPTPPFIPNKSPLESASLKSSGARKRFLFRRGAVKNGAAMAFDNRSLLAHLSL